MRISSKSNTIDLIAVFHWTVYNEIEVSGIDLKQSKKQKKRLWHLERINRQQYNILYAE